MGRATRRRPRPTGLNAGVFQGLPTPFGESPAALNILRLTPVTIGRWANTRCSWTEFNYYLLRSRELSLVRSPHTPPRVARSLILIGRSCAILGTAAQTKAPKKATQPQRLTGRCRSTATGSATSALFFSQLLGLGSAKEFRNSELPSPSSALSVLAVILIVGLVAFGEAYWRAV